jgi:hypothetical protein
MQETTNLLQIPNAGVKLHARGSSACRVFATTPPLPSKGRTIMIQHFLQFVTAVLLVAIFWELCKINGQLKRSIPQISERGQADDADKNRAASPAR